MLAPSTAIPAKAGRPIATETGSGIFIQTGVIALFRFFPSGLRRIIALRYADEVITPAEGDAFSIIPLIDSWIVRGPFVPDHIRNCRIAYEWIARDTLDASARTAHFLCESVIRGGHEIEAVPLFTQAQVGEITGQTSVNVNRVLALLERDGLISRKSARVAKIIDWEELKRMGCFNASYLEAA